MALKKSYLYLSLLVTFHSWAQDFSPPLKEVENLTGPCRTCLPNENSNLNDCIRAICGTPVQVKAMGSDGMYEERLKLFQKNNQKDFQELNSLMQKYMQADWQLGLKKLRLEKKIIGQQNFNLTPQNYFWFNEAAIDYLVESDHIPWFPLELPDSNHLSIAYDKEKVAQRLKDVITPEGQEIFFKLLDDPDYSLMQIARYFSSHSALVNMQKTSKLSTPDLLASLAQEAEKNIALIKSQLKEIPAQAEAFQIDFTLLRAATAKKPLTQPDINTLIRDTLRIRVLHKLFTAPQFKSFRTELVITPQNFYQKHWHHGVLDKLENSLAAGKHDCLESLMKDCYRHGILANIVSAPKAADIRQGPPMVQEVIRSVQENFISRYSLKTQNIINDRIGRLHFIFPEAQENLLQSYKRILLNFRDKVAAQDRALSNLTPSQEQDQAMLALAGTKEKRPDKDPQLFPDDSIRNFCRHYKFSLLSDNYDNSGGGTIVLSWYSISNQDMGKQILAHELGHQVRHAMISNPISEHSAGILAQQKQCLSENHPEIKPLFKNSSEEISILPESSTAAVKKEVPSSFYEDEDFADSVAAVAVKTRSNLGCNFIPLNGPQQFGELALYNHKEIEMAAQDEILKNQLNIHSSPVFRVLNIQLTRKDGLPKTCPQNSLVPKKCF
jgi:hypothetical protein